MVPARPRLLRSRASVRDAAAVASAACAGSVVVVVAGAAGGEVTGSAYYVQTDRAAVISALHHTFLTMGALTILSSLSFWTLRPDDGENVSKGAGGEA